MLKATYAKNSNIVCFYFCFLERWQSSQFSMVGLLLCCAADANLVTNKQFQPKETLVYARLVKYAMQALDIYTINVATNGQTFVRPAASVLLSLSRLTLCPCPCPCPRMTFVCPSKRRCSSLSLASRFAFGLVLVPA